MKLALNINLFILSLVLNYYLISDLKYRHKSWYLVISMLFRFLFLPMTRSLCPKMGRNVWLVLVDFGSSKEFDSGCGLGAEDTRFEEEVMNLPSSGMEAVLATIIFR